MDHFEIINAMNDGMVLEIYEQTRENPVASAYLDGEQVSVSQALRASQSVSVKKISSVSEWSCYAAK